MRKAYFNWSGGKDSSLALFHAQKSGDWDIQRLLTTVNEDFKRISMHGVREKLLGIQAESLGIPLVECFLPVDASMQIYETRLNGVISSFKSEGIETAIFGDIFLEDLRAYREEKLAEIGINAVFPLWKRNTTELIHEFVDLGFKAIIVCVNEQRLDRSFSGRLIDRDFIKDYPATADICGENGEYHSFVFDGPIYTQQIPFEIGETVHRKYPPPTKNDKDHPTDTAQTWDTEFWFTDLLPVILVPETDENKEIL